MAAVFNSAVFHSAVLDSAPPRDSHLAHLLPQGMVRAAPTLAEECYLPLPSPCSERAEATIADHRSSLDRATCVMWSVALVCLGLSVVVWGMLLRDLP